LVRGAKKPSGLVSEGVGISVVVGPLDKNDNPQSIQNDRFLRSKFSKLCMKNRNSQIIKLTQIYGLEMKKISENRYQHNKEKRI
jgi:hypothetical protein